VLKRLRNIVIYLTGNSLASLITFATTIVLTRYASTEVYGQYVVLMSTSMIIASTASEWLKQSIGRMLPGTDVERGSSIVNTAVSTLMIAFCVVSGVALASILIIDSHDPGAIAAFVIGQSAYGVLSAILQAGALAGMLSCSLVVNSISRLSGGIMALIVFGAGSSGLLFGSACGIWITVALMFMGVTHHWDIRVQFNCETKRILRQMFAYGSPFVFWFLLSQILNVGDRYIVKYFLGDAAVGLYGAGYSISYGLITMAVMPVSMAMSPKLMAAWNQGNKKEAIKKAFLLSVVVSCVCAVVVVFLALFSGYAARLFLGKKFVASHHIMWIVAMGSGLWQTSIFWHKIYEFTNRTWVMVSFLALATVVNVGFDLRAVPRYGISGAAWGTVAGYGVYALLNIVAVAAAVRSKSWT
jgi:O-antigen/teichoic acid export membrane protein